MILHHKLCQKILWSLTLAALPLYASGIAYAGASREDEARRVGLALSKDDAPEMQERLRENLDQFTNLSRITVRESAMVSVLEKEYKRALATYNSAQKALEETEKKKIYASLQGGDETTMASLEREAAKRDKTLAEASVRLALIKRRLEPARAQLQALTQKRDALLDSMAGLVPAASGASSSSILIKEQKENHKDNVSTASNASPAVAAGPVPTEELKELSKQQANYTQELADLGYYEEKRANDMAVLETPDPAVDVSKKFKIDGEIRIDNNDTSNHSAIDPERHTKQFPDDRLRARARIYMDYNIDDNWHAVGMLESEKAFHGDDSMDGTIDLDRYYLKGSIGKVIVTVGAFGKTIADGNIYDSRFKGVQLAYGDKKPWYYEGAFGEVNEADEVSAITASYHAPGDQTLEAGVYGFRMDAGNNRNIGMLGYKTPLGGWLHFGAQYLYGHDETEPGGSGYVFSLSRGEENSWAKGNLYAYAKYYYQPRATYVEHTMNGAADYMHGFKGYGLGLSYTLTRDWVLSLEYDDLEDLRYGTRNRTLWTGLSYYFKNYGDDEPEDEEKTQGTK
ncbi:MAG: hypothetical protein LKE33_06780 [Acidaminococcus sp.]|jgi:uncharacterized coiled-coil protein SlyX|nr:hypothetical protein [Acidaminococcus sp.]MCI2115410.1 hypothetical protein [Acidaminococcus sp.]